MHPSMRLISRQPMRLRATFCKPTQPLRPLSTTPTWRLKEDKAQDPQEIEKAKQEQLKTGKRKEELESHSEAGLKADQEKVGDHDQHMKDLQQQTAQEKQDEHPEGKS